MPSKSVILEQEAQPAVCAMFLNHHFILIKHQILQSTIDHKALTNCPYLFDLQSVLAFF